MDLSTYIDNELVYPGPIAVGSSGKSVKFLQELLCLNRRPTAIDGSLGPATLGALHYSLLLEPPVLHPQSSETIQTTSLTPDHFDYLKRTLTQVLSCAPSTNPKEAYPTFVLRLASLIANVGAREVGGANNGPWVRLFCGTGVTSPAWCAGFVCWCLDRAARFFYPNLGPFRTPLGKYTLSCDELASQGISRGLLLSGSHPQDIAEMKSKKSGIFLIRKGVDDWVHTGFVLATYPEFFVSLEGNTNDGGSREGTESLMRFRAYNSFTDYIPFPPNASGWANPLTS